MRRGMGAGLASLTSPGTREPEIGRDYTSLGFRIMRSPKTNSLPPDALLRPPTGFRTDRIAPCEEGSSRSVGFRRSFSMTRNRARNSMIARGGFDGLRRGFQRPSGKGDSSPRRGRQVVAQGARANCIYATSPLRDMILSALITILALTHSHTRFSCRTQAGSGERPPPNDVRLPKSRSMSPRER